MPPIIFEKKMIKYKVPQCIHHQEPYQYFCESCLEPICKRCTVLGPHNSQVLLHLVNHISESLKQRVAEVSDAVARLLPEKRALMLAEIYRLEYRLEEIRLYKDKIRQQNLEFSTNTQSELERSTEDKVLLLKKLIQHFEQELHRVNDVGHFFEEVLRKEDAPLQLLANYRRIDQLLHEFVVAVHDQTIKVFPEDLPKKLSELRFDVKKLSTYRQLNTAKETMLLKVLQKREAAVQKLEEDIKKDLEVETKKCYSEIERNQVELAANLLVCHYCGVLVDEKSINTECKDNLATGKVLNPGFKGFCKVEPEHEYLGNARHYFGEMAQAKNLRPGEDSAISTYLNCLKQKLKLRIENMEIGFKKQLTDHDKSKAGLIRKLDLTYILIEVCKTPEPQANVIMLNLPQEGTMIRYQPLLEEMS